MLLLLLLIVIIIIVIIIISSARCNRYSSIMPASEARGRSAIEAESTHPGPMSHIMYLNPGMSEVTWSLPMMAKTALFSCMRSTISFGHPCTFLEVTVLARYTSWKLHFLEATVLGSFSSWKLHFLEGTVHTAVLAAPRRCTQYAALSSH
jgi:hypothetical protein